MYYEHESGNPEFTKDMFTYMAEKDPLTALFINEYDAVSLGTRTKVKVNILVNHELFKIV